MSIFSIQDMTYHISTFLPKKDILQMTNVDNQTRNMLKKILPKHFGKLHHIELLLEKYDINFLEQCVQTRLQARLLFHIASKYQITPTKCTSIYTKHMKLKYRLKRKSSNEISRRSKVLKVR